MKFIIKTGFTAGDVLSVLVNIEIKAFISEISGKIYIRSDKKTGKKIRNLIFIIVKNRNYSCQKPQIWQERAGNQILNLFDLI